MTIHANKTCSAAKPDQSTCNAPALRGSKFCFFHDPSKESERLEAQSHGGRQNRIKTLQGTTPDARIDDCRDAIALLVQTINQVRKGEIDPRIANSVGFLTNILMKALDHHEIENRIEQLEALLRVQSTTISLKPAGAEDEQLDEKPTLG